MSVSSRTPSPSPSTSSLSSSNIKQNEREDEACEQKKKLKENLLSDAVIRRIMQWTTTTTTNAAPPLALLLVNRRWSQIATEILYAAPPLTSHDSFERLLALLSRCTEATAKSSSTHDYAAMVRQLDVSGSAADNLYMGDLDRMFALCRGLQLELSGCPITDSSIPSLAKNCPLIECMDLSFTNVTLSSLYSLVSNCKNLITLDLSECKPADEDTYVKFTTVSDFQSPLKYLNLRNAAMTDDALSFVSNQCQNLECVILDSCFDITDTSVKELVTKCSSNMSTLDLSFCDKVTDLSLTALVDSEKARRQNSATTTSSCLQELCLAACDDLSPDAVIQAALHYSSSLRLLILDGCEKICRSFIQDYSTVKKCGNNGDALECTLDHAAVQAMLKDHRRYTPPGSPVHGSSSAFSTEAARLLTSICEEEPVAADDADNNNNTSSAPKTLKVQVSFSKTSSPSSSSDSLSSYASPPTSPKRAASVSAAPSSTVTTKRTSVTNKRMSMRMQMSLLSLKEESLDVDKSDARMERTEKIKEWRRSKMMSFPQQQCSAGGERCDDSVYNNIKHTNSSGITQHSTVSEEDGHEVRLSPSLSPDGSSSEEAMLSEAGDHAKGVLLASGRVSRSSRMMRNTTEEVIPPLSEPLPSFLKESLPRPSLILASGRRRRESVIQASPSPSSSSSISTMDAISVGKNNLSSVGNESGADDGGASWGGNVSHTDLRSAIPKNIGWGHVECPEPPAWGKDPSHWVNPAQLISNSSKLAVPVQVPVPVSSFVDPWATSPTQPPPPPTPTLAAPASQPLPFAVNHASSRDVNSGSGVVSWNQSTPAQRVSPQPQYPPPPTPSYITAQYQPPQMRQQTDIGANWGYQQHQYVPPPTEAVAPPPSVTTVVGAGWGSVSTQPPPHVNNVQPSSSTTTTTTVGWGQPPQQMISSHFQHNHSHNITNSNNNNNTSVDAAATAAPRSHEFIFSNSDRGRLLLKLKIETKNGGHQTLPVHELDDPALLAKEFCEFWQMTAFESPLVRLISLRKTNAMRQKGLLKQ